MKLLSVAKPGIIFGNLVTLCGGFFLATRGHFDGLLLLSCMLGMALIIACGCIINNIIDRDIDHIMTRTKKRLLVTGEISVSFAAVLAGITGFSGVAVIYYTTNLLTLTMALTGLFVYVLVYSLWFKRKSVFGTLIGGIAGAMPPVVGYCAVTNRFDLGAVLLFLILFLWQMPHFYAIAICRLSDYSAACIPVLPAIKGTKHTKVSMLLYVIAFAIVAVLPSVFGYAGYIYGVVALGCGLGWLLTAIKGFRCDDERRWARKMFFFSIIVITVLSMAMLIKL